MEGRERAVTMAAPTPSPPPEFPREKPRGSREQRQPSVGLRLCKEMWAIEREEREGLEERQLCQQQGRCSGMDLTRGVWKKKIQIYQIYANFYSSKTSVTSYDFAYEYEYLFVDFDREMDSN